MADNFHFSVNIISRGKGKSAVTSAAYISGEKQFDILLLKSNHGIFIICKLVIENLLLVKDIYNYRL